MSAYASLPGSFLPPFFSFVAPSATTGKAGPIPYTDRVDTVVDAASMQSNSSQPKDTWDSPYSCTTRSSTCDSPTAFKALSLSSPSDIFKESHSLSSKLSDTIITIRSARVDSVELIKSLTSRGSTIARQQANFIAHTPDVDNSPTLESVPTDKCDEDTEDSAFSRPELCNEDTDSDEEYSMYDYSEDFSVPNDNDANDDLHREDDQPRSDGDPPAIKFELSITFQGREYNATRAFPTFVKLRNDLLREYNVNGGNCHRNRRRFEEAKRSNRIDQEGNIKCIPTIRNRNINRSSLEDSVSIPELPRVLPETLGHSGYALSRVARSGFALIQVTAQHYCPEMERWMRQVIEAFPCSQSLSNFLWEPLPSNKASWETIGEGGESIGTLDTIDEGDYFDFDDHST